MEELYRKREKLEDRYEEVGRLLYGFRSKKFLRSVLLYLVDLQGEFGEDRHFRDLIRSIVHSLKHENIEERKNYTPKELLHLYDEEVD